LKDELVDDSKLTIIFFLIQNHIISDLLPLSEIEKEGFQELIGGLIGPLVIKSRRSMMELLNKKYESTKGNLIAELQKAEYACTAADCWTAHKRSFLGMTAHWHSEDKESKEIVRRSFALEYEGFTEAILMMSSLRQFQIFMRTFRFPTR
jgi:hypothetical protein